MIRKNPASRGTEKLVPLTLTRTQRASAVGSFLINHLLPKEARRLASRHLAIAVGLPVVGLAFRRGQCGQRLVPWLGLGLGLGLGIGLLWMAMSRRIALERSLSTRRSSRRSRYSISPVEIV